jgi:hypothetical protein
MADGTLWPENIKVFKPNDHRISFESGCLQIAVYKLESHPGKIAGPHRQQH